MNTTIGIDLAKTTLHAVAMDASGKVVQRRKLGRAKLVEWLANQGPCLIGMEAYTGAHHLARTLCAQGHEVRLMPGQYVKPFVKTHKNDLTDAEAIAEAVQRPQMRFVPIKTSAQLDVQALHRARDRLVGMRTALINQIRGFLLERGLPVARGRRTLEKALPALLEDHAQELGAMLCGLLDCLRGQWRAIDQPIAALDEEILALARHDATSQRLMAIPGVGPMLATRLGGGGRQQCSGLPRRPQPGRLAGPDPTPAQHGQQNQAPGRHPARQPLSAPAAGARGTLAQAGGDRPRRPARPLAAGAGGQGARQRRHGRACGQARPLLPAGIGRCPPLRGWIGRLWRSMGDHGPQRQLSRGRLSPPARHRARVLLGKGGYGHHRRAASHVPVERIGPWRPTELPGPRRADPIAAGGTLTASSRPAGYIHADATWPEPNQACRTGADHTFVRAKWYSVGNGERAEFGRRSGLLASVDHVEFIGS
jgi:transposase